MSNKEREYSISLLGKGLAIGDEQAPALHGYSSTVRDLMRRKAVKTYVGLYLEDCSAASMYELFFGLGMLDLSNTERIKSVYESVCC